MNVANPLLLSITIFLSVISSAQNQETINVVFYNVENLFDTLDNPLTFDEDFTPNGKLQYNSLRYHEKLANLATVIDSSFDGGLPHVVGLCEVENKEVVVALRNAVSVTNKLTVAHMESPDGRGIDNALMYDSTIFVFMHSGLKKIDLGADERPTRGVFYVVLQDFQSKQPLLFLVNHWPSRYGGAEASEWKRLRAAEASVQLIDSLKQIYPNAGLVFMGDLNDHPDNASVALLEACDENKNGPCLTNMHKKFLGTDAGSHAYRGEWGILDQILIDSNLSAGHYGWKVDPESVGFVKKPWMLYESEKDNGFFPSRSFGGTTYFGGFSDHLPAKLSLIKL